jgi:recombination protein RecA
VVEFDIMYGEGISKIGEIIDLGVELEIVKKSGSWFAYEGNKLGQGRDSVKQILQDNPELCDEIEAKIRARFADSKGEAAKALEDKKVGKPAFADAD